jgi:hypothetical protein
MNAPQSEMNARTSLSGVPQSEMNTPQKRVDARTSPIPVRRYDVDARM